MSLNIQGNQLKENRGFIVKHAGHDIWMTTSIYQHGLNHVISGLN